MRMLLTGLGVLILGALGVSQVLPEQAHVERSIIVSATPETVFPYINEFRKFNEWQPWYRRDPKMDVAYDGPEAGAGAKMTWKSDHPEVGSGTQQITASRFNESVETSLSFDGQGEAVATITLKPDAKGTVVTWGFDSQLSRNPVERYMGLMFDQWIGPDYEQGLKNLKQVVESES